MAITVHDAPERRRFEVEVDGERAGFAAYRRRGDEVVFTHTQVRPEDEGHGVASTLVRSALDDLRARGLHAVPLCPYVKAWLDRHPDYADVVAPPPA